MSDQTRERFLAAIAEKVTPEHIIEAHLFQPIRQSGFESGVAVVAVAESVRAVGAAHGAVGGADSAGAPAEGGAENRLAVFTAKYRLMLKGPERGKWDFSMQAEADAPLVTVDVVVRGVQRRSGDQQEPERLTGEEFRALLPPRASAG